MTAATGRRAEEWSRLGLAEALRWAVPLRMLELRRSPPYAERRRRLPYGMTVSLGAGDTVMFHGKNPKNTIITFDAYAWALALLALETPGGVTFLGVHWCTAGHEGCPHEARPGPEPAGPWWEPLAELEALARAEGWVA